MMHRRTLTVGIIGAAILALGLAGPAAAGQAVASPPAKAPPVTALVVAGDVATPLDITPADLAAMPRTSVEVRQEDGQTTTYEGVLVTEILKRAGTPLGADLRGAAVASYVLATASDGYQVVFSLAELDAGFTSNDIIVADTIDGKPLFAYQGPFRIVAPKDKRGARSIRMLQRLEVVRLKK